MRRPLRQAIPLAKHSEHVVEVLHRGAADLLDRGQRPPSEFGIGVEQLPRRTGLERGHGQGMADGVVQIAGEPVPFGQPAGPRLDDLLAFGRRRTEQYRRHQGRESTQRGDGVLRDDQHPDSHQSPAPGVVGVEWAGKLVERL